jgi:ribosomal protein S18 acetylase RimI-like enzyme
VDAPAASIEAYRGEHFAEVKALWEEAFPDDPPHNRAEAAIPAKLAMQPELLLVALAGGAVVGTVMAGYDGHRGWLYSVAVRRSHHRAGIGTLLVREAELRLARLGCGKVNLQVRAENVAVAAFYRRLGYEIEDRVSMARRLRG